MNWWSLHLEAVVPAEDTEPDVDAVEELLGVLPELGAEGPAVTAWGHRFGTTFSMEAGGVSEAVHKALETFDSATCKVGLPSHMIVRCDVMTEEERDRELDRPVFPELVGVKEIGALLGVSKQRASIIARRLPNFPDPITKLASGPVWVKDAVTAFRQDWSQRKRTKVS